MKNPYFSSENIDKGKNRASLANKNRTMSLFFAFVLCAALPMNAVASVLSIFVSQSEASEYYFDNSQNMAILDPETVIEESKESIAQDFSVEGGALVPEVGPLGTTLDIIDLPSIDEITTYTVRDGDSISEIAEMFGVSSNTILWANDLPKGASLKKGQVLTILPVTGIRHTVKKGDTIKKIASLYKGDVDDIASFNGIAPDEILVVGSVVIIPDGEMTPVEKKVTTTSSSSKKEKTYGTNFPEFSGGAFIRPIKGGIRTQGLHARNGVDIGAKTGTPIYAAAGGRVIVADGVGYNGGFGSYVVIDHGGGVKTLYAHMSRVGTSVGASVSQGELIGYVGNTGRSTGPHLHFEVHGAKNPLGTNPRYGL